MVDMPPDRLHPHQSRGYAYVEFETPEEAQKALKYMDGGRLACVGTQEYKNWCLYTVLAL